VAVNGLVKTCHEGFAGAGHKPPTMDWKQDFPALQALTYLDSAASSQTPLPVIEAMTHYLRDYRANVHRGAYELSGRATAAYEEARSKVAEFLGTLPDQCVFTRGTTEGLNLLAQSLCRGLPAGQRIALTALEHHSNLVPWQQWASACGHSLDWVEIEPNGQLSETSLQEVLARRPAILSMTWVSNVLGTINPIARIARQCREQGTLFVVDAAQGVPHLITRVNDLGCDFLTFSGHKMLGPTGIGVLWGKSDRLESLPPYHYGGSMVGLVTREKTTFAELPQRLEAGTPPIAEAIGLGAAVDYLNAYGMTAVREHEKDLLTYALAQLGQIEGLELAGPCDPEIQSGVVSFRLRGVHPHDIATVLDRRKVCVRAGHHCCQPLMRYFTDLWTPGARAPVSLVRASFYLYNNRVDVDKLVDGLHQARKVFSR